MALRVRTRIGGAFVAQIDGLVTVNIISPLRTKICSKGQDNNSGMLGKDGLMALPKLTQFLTLTGLLANILGETSHQKKALKIIESTNNQILRVYVERMEKDMIEDFRDGKPSQPSSAESQSRFWPSRCQ